MFKKFVFIILLISGSFLIHAAEFGEVSLSLTPGGFLPLGESTSPLNLEPGQIFLRIFV
ncbi:MAG: hypothetical protein PF693_02860 [Spirochaetia bacterium]|jgi:hypothetical protein|nr:hypothetical protein [Spirochaetia bacterium]